jgi:hypothetical protein
MKTFLIDKKVMILLKEQNVWNVSKRWQITLYPKFIQFLVSLKGSSSFWLQFKYQESEWGRDAVETGKGREVLMKISHKLLSSG